MATGLVFIDRLGIAFVFADIKAEMGLGNTQLGSLMAITSFAWAVSSILFAYVSDRMGGRAKLVVISCLIAFSLATGLTGVMTTFAGLLAVRFFIGVFEGPMIPLIQATVVKISAPRRTGTNLAVVIAGGSCSELHCRLSSWARSPHHWDGGTRLCFSGFPAWPWRLC